MYYLQLKITQLNRYSAHKVLNRYWLFDVLKKSSNKEGRKELRSEATRITKTIATDKDFHKGLKKEFKPTIILFAVIGFALLLGALGIGD